MVSLISMSDHCSICESAGLESDLLVCDTCNEYVCENCAEEVGDGVFCSEGCLLRG